MCEAAVARRLWGEPRCRRGDEPAQPRGNGAGGGARERMDGAEAAWSGAWIATNAARVKRSALACDLNVWDDPRRCFVCGYLAGGATGAIGCRSAHICGLSEWCWACGRSVWALHVACDL